MTMVMNFNMMTAQSAPQHGGKFDFEDGGTYSGNWEDGKAHGFGVCTGPKGQGEYSGTWNNGYEQSGVYRWHDTAKYEGTWMMGKRSGLGVETKERWMYKGEWSDGFKGRYGVRISMTSTARYEGTWTAGLQDGYGIETYSDGGTYSGQWLSGVRHGLGIRKSAGYGLATSHRAAKNMRESLTSLRSEDETDLVVKQREKKMNEVRGGFVLQLRGDEEGSGIMPRRLSVFMRQSRTSLKKTFFSGLKLKKQKSTGDISNPHADRRRTRPTGSVRSTISNVSHLSQDSVVSAETNFSFVGQDDHVDPNVTEIYCGEWKGDKRSGFGVCERTDGLRYEGEWENNKKHGYGCTTFFDGSKETGKYKNNQLISSGKKNKLPLLRSSKIHERVEGAVMAAQQAAKLARWRLYPF